MLQRQIFFVLSSWISYLKFLENVSKWNCFSMRLNYKQNWNSFRKLNGIKTRYFWVNKFLTICYSLRRKLYFLHTCLKILQSSSIWIVSKIRVYVGLSWDTYNNTSRPKFQNYDVLFLSWAIEYFCNIWTSCAQFRPFSV